MLSITTKSPYALRALTELARMGAEDPVPIGELARRRDIPVQFLEQLFAVLRRAGLLQVPARRQGRLLRSRASRRDITVLELVELLDGRARRAAPRASSPTPPRRPAPSSARTTIADVVEREAREAGAAMYYI